MSLAEPGVSEAARLTASPTLAGASIAAAGRTVPSGRVCEPSGSALAASTPTPARLAVHAAERTASGMMAIARCSRVELDISCALPLVVRWLDRSPRTPSGHVHTSSTTIRHTKLRARRLWANPHPWEGRAHRMGSLARLRDNDPVTSATIPSTTAASEAWFERARAVTPGGVNSPVRAFTAVGGTPRFITSASGAWLTDADGNDYVDLICSWGPMLLGHAHPDVQAAVAGAVARGTSYGTPTEPEVELAEEIVRRTPVERVRFVSSGTEATMSAIRLARGATGRDLVVKFAGCYHGHVDPLLAEAGSGVATLAVPGTSGVPATSAAETLVLPYNDRAAVAAAFEAHGSRIACLITEASPGNMGVVPPAPGFNAFLAETCRAHGALFVTDEVMTGFRASKLGQ